MSVLIPKGSEAFQNGEPAFDYDECFSCFENKGILFRLVNTEKKRWAFYNDTPDLIIRVRAKFGTGSVIKALQRTELTNLIDPAAAPASAPTTDAGGNPVAAVPRASGKYAYEATLEIEPGFTELFIEGTINGFSMDFTTESAPAKNVKFENGQPSVPFDKMYKCFKETGNGLLFRLVNEREDYWAFYNDTTTYVMKVLVDFDDDREIVPLGETQVVSHGDVGAEGAARSIVYTLYVQPGKTEKFIQGKPSVYKLSFAAEPVKSETPVTPGAGAPETIVYKNGKPDPVIIPHLSHVYKCFKEHDNGLLFRCVDDVNKLWAFYNDTTGFVMNVNVRFPPKKGEEDHAFAPNVQVMEDHGVPGGYIAAAQVEPGETIPFLVGDLTGIPYELAFSAHAADTNQAETNPQYENGTPDLTKISNNRIDEVYKCFKEHGNGLLFRLVTFTPENRKVGSWAFYNDTKDVVASITVSFGEKAKVRALGHTKIDADDEMGVVYVLEVEPGHTEPFVEGDIATFTTKFTAKRVSHTPAAPAVPAAYAPPAVEPAADAPAAPEAPAPAPVIPAAYMAPSTQ